MKSVAKSPVPKSRKRPPKVVPTYRGIRLPDMSAGSQFTCEEVERAIKAVIARHPEAFAVRKD